MKILTGSDFHFEMPKMRTNLLPPLPDSSEYDVVVVAGDVGYRLDGIKWMEKFFPKDKPIIFVPGNHEYYTSNFDDVTKMFDEYKGRVKILNPGIVQIPEKSYMKNDTIVVPAVTFIGATMWSDSKLEGFRDLDDWQLQRSIADFKWGWTPAQMRSAYQKQYDFVWTMLAHQHPDNKVVVITHFVPTQLATSPRFAGNAFNPYFLNDQDDIMNQFQPNVWVAGHTHDRFDFIHPSGTRVVINPHGYVGETPGFEWKIVEV